MPEYIAKEQALEAVTRNLALYGDEWIAIYNIVGAIPPADVAPVIYAQWKLYDKDIYENDILLCSHCRNTIPAKAAKHFCTYCGARMDGEENG